MVATSGVAGRHGHGGVGALDDRVGDGAGEESCERGHGVVADDDQVPAAAAWAEGLVGEAEPEGEGDRHPGVLLSETGHRFGEGGVQILEIGLVHRLASGPAVLSDGVGVPQGVQEGEREVAQGRLAVGELDDRQRLGRAIGADRHPVPGVAVRCGAADHRRGRVVGNDRGADRSQHHTLDRSANSRSEDHRVCVRRRVDQHLMRISGHDVPGHRQVGMPQSRRRDTA